MKNPNELEQKNNELENAVAAAVTEQIENVLEHLSIEQKAALESKFNALAPEVQSVFNAKYPQLTTVSRYIVRQMSKEANGKLASNLRPGWYQTLMTQAAGLRSGNEEIRKYSEQALINLADQFESKEATSLLKKYRANKDMTTKDAHIVQLAGIFGVAASNLV